MMQEERRKSEKLKRADRGNLSALRQYPFSNAPISFSSTALQQLIPVHHTVECCINDKKQAKVQNSQSLLHCLVQCSVALCVCDALPLLRPVLLMPTMTGSLAAACQPQLKLKKIGCHRRTRKSKKVQQSPKAQIEKNRPPRQNEKSPSPVKNGKVRRVKISLTETKQGSALKTEILSGAILQKRFYFYSSLLRLAKHQFEKSGLNLVLEYEKGGSVRRAMPLTLNYFPFRSIFPTPL